MFNIGYIIPIVMSCHLLFLELLKYKTQEVSKNIIHIINGIIFILCHNYESDMIYIIHVAIGFYVYDMIYIVVSIVKTNNKLKQQAPYIIHHILTIHILRDSLYNQYFLIIWKGYSILEMSNMMLYISYHVHKEYKNNKHLIYITDFIQLIWYTYYRAIKISFFCYSARHKIYEQTGVFRIMLFILYLFGILWSYKLIMKNINNYKSYKLLRQ